MEERKQVYNLKCKMSPIAYSNKPPERFKNFMRKKSR